MKRSTMVHVLLALILICPAGLKAASELYVFRAAPIAATDVTGDGTLYQIGSYTEQTDSIDGFDTDTGEYSIPASGFYVVTVAVHLSDLTLRNTYAGIGIRRKDSAGSTLATYWGTRQTAYTTSQGGTLYMNQPYLGNFNEGDKLCVMCQVDGTSKGVDILSSGWFSAAYLSYLDPDEIGGGVQNATYTSDWNGVTYDNYEDYAANSTVTLWNSQGVVMTKERFTYLAGMFGIAIAAIITWAFFKAVL